MAKEKQNKEKPYSSQMMFFGGVGLCLLAIILIMNVGAVARIISYPFIYSFGLLSFGIYAVAYVVGILFLFAKNKLKIVHKIRFLGYVLIFVSLLVLITQIYASYKGVILATKNYYDDADTIIKYNFHEYFVSATKIPHGYINEPFVDVFITYPFGGGYFGYALTAVLNEFVGVPLTYIISICVLLIGIVISFLPNIISWSKERQFSNKTRTKQEFYNLDNNAEALTFDTLNKGRKTPVRNKRVENIDVVKSAASLEIVAPKPLVSASEAQGQESSAQASAPNPTHSVPLTRNNSVQYEEISTFKYARFNRGVTSNNELPSNVQKANAPFEKSVQVVQEPETNKMPIREQMTFDFDNKEDENYRFLPEPEPVMETRQEKEIAQFHQEEVNLAQTPTSFINNSFRMPTKEQPSVPSSFQPKKEHLKFIPPSVDLLNTYEVEKQTEINRLTAEERKELINAVFKEFNVNARTNSYVIGPTVTRFNIEYGTNVSANSVNRLVDDISIRLGGVTTRFEMIIEGERYSGLEIPNAVSTTVGFRQVFEQLPDAAQHPTAVAFGVNIAGKVVCADFAEFPHALVAGTTGSGKSIYIHSVITTLIMRNSPSDLKIILIDPKRVEMTKYKEMPHLLCPIICEASEANVAMNKLCEEMDRRYKVFGEADGATDIKQFNEYAEAHNLEKMPYIIVVIDEYADLVDSCREISQPIVRICQKSRSAGIHILIATQRPSTNVITGVIKGNLPTRVALMTASYTDSAVIVDKGGAEKLMGKGDMLVSSALVSRVGMVRLQGCYIQGKEISKVVNYLKERYPVEYNPDFLDLVDRSKQEAQAVVRTGGYAPGAVADFENDEKYHEIKEWAMTQEYVSMSKIQRECYVGFNKAGKILKKLQEEGIIASEAESSSKGCKVLVHYDDGDDEDSIPTSDELIS